MFSRCERLANLSAARLLASSPINIWTKLLTKANFEASYYFTTTDQLDDISNKRLRGASNSNDGFGTVMRKLDYALK